MYYSNVEVRNIEQIKKTLHVTTIEEWSLIKDNKLKPF